MDMLFNMSIVKEFKVSICNRNEIRDFIEKWHYSKSINGVNLIIVLNFYMMIK